MAVFRGFYFKFALPIFVINSVHDHEFRSLEWDESNYNFKSGTSEF